MKTKMKNKRKCKYCREVRMNLPIGSKVFRYTRNVCGLKDENIPSYEMMMKDNMTMLSDLITHELHQVINDDSLQNLKTDDWDFNICEWLSNHEYYSWIFTEHRKIDEYICEYVQMKYQELYPQLMTWLMKSDEEVDKYLDEGKLDYLMEMYNHQESELGFKFMSDEHKEYLNGHEDYNVVKTIPYSSIHNKRNNKNKLTFKEVV